MSRARIFRRPVERAVLPRLPSICLIASLASAAGGAQIVVEAVERMPNSPRPYRLRDWRAVALGFDRLAFDPEAEGEYLPIMWWDRTRTNIDRLAFGLPPYVGPKKRIENHPDGITTMGAVLGATVAGIDKSEGEHNWVLMCETFFNRRNGQNLVLNHPKTRSGNSFWYEVFPHILFYCLADRYPGTGSMDAIMKSTADRWYEACVVMGGGAGGVGGGGGVPDFNHTAFDFIAMRPVDNGRWKEPDAAAGIAWLQYSAWQKWRDPKHLRAADWCMRFLEAREENPYYEVEMPFGAYTAARMNAEEGRNYDLHKLVNWCFERSAVRPDMAVITDSWDGYDVHGLVGSVNRPPRAPGGGYAFAMNTFAMAMPLVPLVRYDDRYARAVGKWMLNAANAARLFYPNEHPPERQSCPDWKGDPGGVIAYEGIRHLWDGNERLHASGDPVKHDWPFHTDFGLYGSAFVGVFGGVVRPTNVERILRLDLLATDFFAPRAYPTYLYFNPYDRDRSVDVDVGDGPRALYDAAHNRFVARAASGVVRVTVPADGAIVLVLTPAGAEVERRTQRLFVGGVVVDYVLP